MPKISTKLSGNWLEKKTTLDIGTEVEAVPAHPDPIYTIIHYTDQEGYKHNKLRVLRTDLAEAIKTVLES